MAGDVRKSIQIVREPLDVTAAYRAVESLEAGGIDLFVGTTRAEKHAGMGALVRLDYDAYPEMALREMEKLVKQAEARWPMIAVVLWHRIGPVAVGEASVVIGVSCVHRGESFEACRFLIDELKRSVPIWKKEVYAKAARWQGDAGSA